MPKQVILKEFNLEVGVEDLSANEAQEGLLNRLIQAEDSIAFDMSQPLIKVRVFKLAGDKYCVYYNMHHLILDGWSSEIFIQELIAVYHSYREGKEPELAPLKRGYSDWLEMQQEWQATPEALSAKEFWLAELAKPLPSLDLPLDFKRPDLQTFNGRFLNIHIDKEDADQLKQVAKQGNATLNMVLLAVYFLFLQKTTGDRDIIVGMPLAGRDDQDFEKVIGLFINTVCIRVKFQNLNNFNDLLQYVKEKSLSAFKNGKFPFDLLVNLINPERIPGKSPIFSTMFQFYDNIPQENENVSKFELNFLCQEIAGEIIGRLEYNTDLFAKETIERFRNSLLEIVKMILANPARPLNEINLIKEAEKQKIIRSFNEELESE
jgi:surfactin family lipopeptide synthetase A